MSARAFIAFLRCEATQADERARALRTVAANIENHASSDEAARKAAKRKQARDPNRPKRQHTAYTMFVMENYEAIKKQNTDMPSKEIISMVARQWAQVSEEEKGLWKERAVASSATQQAAEVVEELQGAGDEFYAEGDGDKGEDGGKKKRAASPNKKAKVSAEV